MSIDQVRANIEMGIAALEQAPIDPIVIGLGQLGLSEQLRMAIATIETTILQADLETMDLLALEETVHTNSSEGVATLMLALLGAARPEATNAIQEAELTCTHSEETAELLQEMLHRSKGMSSALARFLTHLEGYEAVREEAQKHIVASQAARMDAVFQARAYADHLE